MPHLNTGPGHYDSTTSAYIVRLDTPEPTLMLHMHKKLGRYFQVGGHIERDENPWQALCREVAEESGYQMEQLHVLQPVSRLKQSAESRMHPTPLSISTHKYADLDHYHTDLAFALVATEPPRGQVAKGESQLLRTFTASELRALPRGEIAEEIRRTGLFVLEECLASWEKVDSSMFSEPAS